MALGSIWLNPSLEVLLLVALHLDVAANSINLCCPPDTQHMFQPTWPDLVAGQTNDFLFKTRKRQRKGTKSQKRHPVATNGFPPCGGVCFAWLGMEAVGLRLCIPQTLHNYIITLLRPSSCFPPLSWSQTPQSCRYTLKWFHWFRWTWQRVCIVYIQWCICVFAFLLSNCSYLIYNMILWIPTYKLFFFFETTKDLRGSICMAAWCFLEFELEYTVS